MKVKKIARILIPVILVGMLVVPLAATEATVSIEDASAAQGETVTVPINIADVENMCGADIWLSYDKQVVTVEKVEVGNIGTVTYNIDNNAGKTKMVWDTAEGKTGSFVFAHITFKAVGNPCDESKLDLDVKELYDCDLVDIQHGVVDGTFKISCIPTTKGFDTGYGTYASIFGTHNGTITPNQTITVNKLYTYPCAGTGGHTESIKLYENDIEIANGTWNGYQGDWHNITIHNVTGAPYPYVMLLENHKYNYTIRTGSYPQIHHTPALPTANGWINCTKFTDANGKIYYDWIPAIKLFLQ